MTITDEALAAEVARLKAEKDAREAAELEGAARVNLERTVQRLRNIDQERIRRREAGLSLVHEVWPGCPAPELDLWGNPLAVGGDMLTARRWVLTADGVNLRRFDGELHLVCSPLFPLRYQRRPEPVYRPSQVMPLTDELVGGHPIVVGVRRLKRWGETTVESLEPDACLRVLVDAGLAINGEAFPARQSGNRPGVADVGIACSELVLQWLADTVLLTCS
ncbi:MAG: hypothetical protein AB1679_10755 [Actinomycetota bacterium]|jgi:hypothetical protein